MKTKGLLLGIAVVIFSCTPRESGDEGQSDFVSLKQVLTSNQQQNLLSSYRRIPANDRTPGFGFSTLTSDWLGKSVQYTDENDLQSIGNGQDVAFSLQKIESYSSLRDILQVDAHLSLGFSVFSADFSSSLYSSSFVSQFKQYILVQVSVENAPQILKQQKLTSSAIEVAGKGYKNFVETYGTEYVIGQVTGGKLYGLIEIESHDEQDYKNISASLNASIGVWGKFDGSFSQKVESISKQASLKVILFKSGGKKGIPTTPDSLLLAAKNFPTEVSTNSKVLYLLLSKYNGVGGYPSEFNSTYYSDRLDRVIRKQDQIFTYIENWKQHQNDLGYITTHGEEFDNKYISTLNTYREASEKAIEDYQDWNSYLIVQLMNDKNINVAIPYPQIPKIERKQGWQNTKKENYLRTQEVKIETQDWHNQPGLVNYQFSFKAANEKNALKNVRIETCSENTPEGGSCGWNGGNFAALKAGYNLGKGFSEINGNVNVGSRKITFFVKCDEFEIK